MVGSLPTNHVIWHRFFRLDGLDHHDLAAQSVSHNWLLTIAASPYDCFDPVSLPSVSLHNLLLATRRRHRLLPRPYCLYILIINLDFQLNRRQWWKFGLLVLLCILVLHFFLLFIISSIFLRIHLFIFHINRLLLLLIKYCPLIMAQISVGGTGLVLKSAIQLAATSLSSTSNGDGAQVFGFPIGKLL